MDINVRSPIQLQNPGDAILAAYEVQELAWWQASPQEASPSPASWWWKMHNRADTTLFKYKI